MQITVARVCREVTLCQPSTERSILVAITARMPPVTGMPTRDRQVREDGSMVGAYLLIRIRLQVRMTASHKRELTGAPAMPQPSRPNRT